MSMGGGLLDGVGKGTGKGTGNLRVQKNNDLKEPDYLRGWVPWTRPASDGSQYKPSTRYSGLLGELMNFGLDSSRNINNFIGSLYGRNDPLGGGLGDSMVGSNPADRLWDRARGGVAGGLPKGMGQGSQPQFEETQLPDFMSFLQQAMDFVGGGTGGINYDPLRNDARNRHSEYDARLAAMYDQLAGSIRDDNKTVQSNYGQAIEDSAARAQETQESIQQASNVADDRNAEVRRNLGIEEAQGNLIDQGRDLNTHTAQALSDVAARGQISGDALSRNQMSAEKHNTNLAGAAGLSGNMQRARVQSELASLLAQYDMEEQRANQQAQQSNFSNYMNLGNTLYEDAWRKLNYGDDLGREQYERMAAMNQPDAVSQAYQFLQELLTQREDLSMDDLLKYTQGIGNIGKLY